MLASWVANVRRWRPRPAVCFGVGLVLVLVAWAMSSPPFSAPDEGQHYLRALSIANGHLLGPRVRYQNAGETAQQVAFAAHDARGVEVSAAMSPAGFRCVNGSVDEHSCIEATATGDYYPLPYLLPAIAAKVGKSADTALWAMRVASLIPCAGLLVLAVLLLWTDAPMASIGLVAAFTPMVLFVASVLNPSGLEITASLAFAAAVLRLTRDGTASPLWVWVAMAASGAALLLSFQASPAFALFDLLVGMGLLGGRRLHRLVTAELRRSLGVGIVLLGALALWLIYSQVSGLAHGRFGVNPLISSLTHAVVQMHVVLYEAVGVFGSLTVSLPAIVRFPWLLIEVGLVVAALALGTPRDRWVLAATLVVAFGFPVLADAWIYRHSGFALQARQVLPVLLLIPLVAGEVLYRNAGRVARLHLLRIDAASLFVLVLLGLGSWVVNARDATGAPGTKAGTLHPHWDPPLGWAPWIALAIVGTAAMLAAAAMRLRSEPPGSERLAA